MMPKASPLTDKVYDGLKELIKQKKFNEKGCLPSQSVLMQTFKVSAKTIRAALSKLIDEDLIYSAKGAGYFLTKKTKPIAFVYQLDNYEKQTVLAHIRDFLSEKGIFLQLFELPLHAKMCHILDFKQISGVIHFSNIPLTKAHLKELRVHNIPVVNIMGNNNNSYDTFNSDYATGMNMLINNLHAKGHRRIIYIDDTMDVFPMEIAKNSYTQIMIQLGLLPTIITMPTLLDLPKKAINKLVKLITCKKNPVTAVICNTALMGTLLLPYLERNNIVVPGTVSLAGFGWSPDIDYFMVPYRLKRMLTIDPSYKAIGEETVNKLLDRIAGYDKAPQPFFIHPDLNEGNSVIKI
jgi:DNA-binding LacI/PurR family transcriptional regulator